MKIAGREVKLGDELYSKRMQRFGAVRHLTPDSGMGIITFVKTNSNPVDFTFTDGGYINGNRDLYWHTDIQLDLTTRDSSKVEEALRFLLQFGGIL